MRKKLLCIIMAVLMIMQCAPLVHAVDETENLEPAIDMEVKRSDALNFVNGPVTVNSKTEEFDYRVTLYMEPVFNEFVKWYDLATSIINNWAKLDSTLDKNAIMAELNNLEIKGQFTVKIVYPKALEVPEAFVTGGDMYGFNENAKKAFRETAKRNLTSEGENNILTISIEAHDNGNPLLAGSLNANKDVYLDDITLGVNGVTAPDYGTYTVQGTLSGYTNTDGTVNSKIAKLLVNYKGKQLEGKANASAYDTLDVPYSTGATVILKKSGGMSPSVSGGGGTPSTKITVEFNVDGEIIETITTTGKVSADKLPTPEKEGYIFDGWYHDSSLKEKVTGDITAKENITLYGHWISSTLDTEDHFAYVIGYPDGTVRPENNISREEVATIFYRLLREDSLISIATDKNNFTDVETERWSNKAISSLANGGYINGYEDGSFRPEDFITRAEFATMATRYAKLSAGDGVNFSDIAGHWAEDYIIKAAGTGWVTGYEDGTFGPEKYITRAEVMTIINRMLVRYVDAEGLHKDTVLWIDMNGTEWYYYNVLEATNSHDYDRREDGKLENWTSINENRIWIELDEMENAD